MGGGGGRWGGGGGRLRDSKFVYIALEGSRMGSAEGSIR